MGSKSILRNALIGGGLSVLLGACATSAPPVEGVSFDGMTKLDGTKFGDVYVKPGADLKAYDEFGVTPCTVAFKKNWLRDQNSNRIDLTNRVTQKDVDRIKDKLAADCESKFRAALAEDPAYKVVEQFHDGEQVLILRPSIVNLDINAPDVRSAGISYNYTTSAGEMTLYLELLDGTTGDTVARIVDRQRDYDKSYLQWSNSVTNKAEADRIMKRWASLLRSGLDKARAAN